MKRALALVLTIALAFLGATATIQPPKGFDGGVWNSTLALYGTKDTSTHFLCTTEIIKKSPVTTLPTPAVRQWQYELLSAGHCVQLIPDGVQFSVSDEIDGPRTNVVVVKAHYDEDGLDFSLFRFISTKEYPVMSLGSEDGEAVGNAVIVPNFSLGTAKQLSHGVIGSQNLANGYFVVQGLAGPGASGSAVISARTHQIIGILVIGLGEGGFTGFGVEPISAFQKFLDAPVQPHPVAPKDDEEN